MHTLVTVRGLFNRDEFMNNITDEAMKPRKDSADKGAGSGCMARLVRCSSLFFMGCHLPLSGEFGMQSA
jgi:hypothetical protein